MTNKSGESMKTGLIPDWLDRLFLKSVTPAIDLFTLLDINPNWITVGGLTINVLSGYLIFEGKFVAAALLIGVAVICDFIDGKVASATGKVTEFGSMLDSILDRYSDAVIYIGICGYFLAQDYAVPAMAALLALTGTFVTSYARAIGASKGYVFRTRIIRRQERITILFAGLILAGLHNEIAGLFAGFPGAYRFIEIVFPVVTLSFAVYFLAIFTNLTAAQRLLMLRKLAISN